MEKKQNSRTLVFKLLVVDEAIALSGLRERFNGQAPKMLKPQHEHIARAFDVSVPLREVSRKCPSK